MPYLLLEVDAHTGGAVVVDGAADPLVSLTVPVVHT